MLKKTTLVRITIQFHITVKILYIFIIICSGNFIPSIILNCIVLYLPKLEYFKNRNIKKNQKNESYRLNYARLVDTKYDYDISLFSGTRNMSISRGINKKQARCLQFILYSTISRIKIYCTGISIFERAFLLLLNK